MNLNSNDDTDVDTEEISTSHKRGFNKVYKEFKTYPYLEIATEDVRNLGLACLKLHMKFETLTSFIIFLTSIKNLPLS